VIAALYLCYAGVGWRVLGFLPSYASEEGLLAGSGFWAVAVWQHLFPWAPDGTPVYLMAAALCMGVLA
jgi:hypothetical protein